MTALRNFLYAAWLYGGIAVVGLAYLPFALFDRRAAAAAPRVWARSAIWGLKAIGGVTLEVRGLDNVPEGAALIAGKHQSMLDTIAPFAILRDPAFVLKAELGRLPVYSYYVRRGGHAEVDRDGGAAALKAMLRTAEAAAREGRPVVIFPEGTRTAPGVRGDYKPGVAALYRALGRPCVPVALNTGLCWSAKGVRLTPGRVVIEFLPPIPPGLSREAFMARLEAAVEEASLALLPTERRPHPVRSAPEAVPPEVLQ